MDKTKVNVDISVMYTKEGYTVISHKKNVTQLEVINDLCREAAEQKKVIMKAELSATPTHSILEDNSSHKSL